MTLTRAVATPPGQPTNHRDLSVTEETTRQAEMDAAAPATLRKQLRRAFSEEGVARIAAQEPAWNSFDMMALIVSIWTRLGRPRPAQALARDIYLYVRDSAVPKLGTLTLTELQSVDPTAAQPFAAVDPGDAGWPT